MSNDKKQQKMENLRKENLNKTINFKAELIKMETENQIRKYGKDSATVNDKYFKDNISIFISHITKTPRLSILK